jgi:hypothetical protein
VIEKNSLFAYFIVEEPWLFFALAVLLKFLACERRVRKQHDLQGILNGLFSVSFACF